jgi:hypothetical protein
LNGAKPVLGEGMSREVGKVRLIMRGSIEYNKLCNGLEAARITYNIYILTHFHTCTKALCAVP